MIEAELKADVRDPSRVAEQLRVWAAEERSIYRDAYYDTPDRALGRGGRELRLRTVSSATTKHLLTYKEPAVDEESQSKPEYETEVADRNAVERTLLGLGLIVDIAFEKHCRNYRFRRDGRDFLGTLVQIPEIGDSTFLELEILVPTSAAVPAALAAIRNVFVRLDIDPDRDLNGRYYQEMVRTHRTS
ncbi:MAG: class IV adenylate cyclase [Mycobacterium sp.]|nr:class IV adenylate cyclase [Mycobacterium sp.]